MNPYYYLLVVLVLGILGLFDTKDNDLLGTFNVLELCLHALSHLLWH